MSSPGPTKLYDTTWLAGRLPNTPHPTPHSPNHATAQINLGGNNFYEWTVTEE
jgi:hypothetical protein